MVTFEEASNLAAPVIRAVDSTRLASSNSFSRLAKNSGSSLLTRKRTEIRFFRRCLTKFYALHTIRSGDSRNAPTSQTVGIAFAARKSWIHSGGRG